MTDGLPTLVLPQPATIHPSLRLRVYITDDSHNSTSKSALGVLVTRYMARLRAMSVLAADFSCAISHLCPCELPLAEWV